MERYRSGALQLWLTAKIYIFWVIWEYKVNSLAKRLLHCGMLLRGAGFLGYPGLWGGINSFRAWPFTLCLKSRLAFRGLSFWSVNHTHLQMLYHHSSFTKVLQNDCIFLRQIRLTRYVGNRLSLKCLLNLDSLYLRKTVTGQNITDKYVALRKVLRYGRSFG